MPTVPESHPAHRPGASAVNLADKLSQVRDLWTPHRVASFDDHQVLVARVEGEFVWHAHADEDEVFLTLRGTLFVDLRDRTVAVGPGELYVVPRGVEHRTRTADGETVELLSLSRRSLHHTGGERHAVTVDDYPEL